jgi:hypothetical protein
MFNKPLNQGETVTDPIKIELPKVYATLMIQTDPLIQESDNPQEPWPLKLTK